MLSQEELKELLHYDPDTGIFTWLVSNGNCVKLGDVAGYLNKIGYIRIGVKGKLYMAHRLACLYMTGAFPKTHMDHIKHVKSDNRWSNLREVTQHENTKNQSRRTTNTSGITGIYWNKRLRKWEGKIMVDGKSEHLGVSHDKFEIICARKSAENKYGFHPNHGQQ